jgi:hypothetical protein
LPRQSTENTLNHAIRAPYASQNGTVPEFILVRDAVGIHSAGDAIARRDKITFATDPQTSDTKRIAVLFPEIPKLQFLEHLGSSRVPLRFWIPHKQLIPCAGVHNFQLWEQHISNSSPLLNIYSTRRPSKT